MRRIDRAPVPGQAYRMVTGTLTTSAPVPYLDDAAKRGAVVRMQLPGQLGSGPASFVWRAPHSAVSMVSYHFAIADLTRLYPN